MKHDNTKCNNNCIIGTPEGQEREQGIENLIEKTMTENFPNLVNKNHTQVQKAQRSQTRLN